MDVSKGSISVAVLQPGRAHAELDKIFHDDESVRRFKRLAPGLAVVGVLRNTRLLSLHREE